MVDADNGWAVGHVASDMAILNWNCSSWNEIAAPGLGTLYSVFLFNATDGWAVGEFDIVRLVPPGEWVVPELPAGIMLSFAIVLLISVAFAVKKLIEKPKLN